jgi:sugar lactone lactonase YvrE
MLRTHRFAISTLALLLTACGEVASDDGSVAQPAPEEAELVTSAPLAGLARGRREVLVANIPSAENLLFLSDDRLLVAGDKGVYLLSRDASGAPRAENLKADAPCAFGGTVEVNRTIYVNCYNMTKAFIYASSLESLEFAPILEVADTPMSNSLTSDGQHLYLSATLQAKILRLTIDATSPLTLREQTVFAPSKTQLPNGTKVYQGALYWTDLLAIKRAPLDGSSAPVTLATRVTLFDDLFVDERGMIVADYTGNLLLAYDASGKKVAQTPAVFQSPSAMLPARGRFGLGQDDLVVTERGGGVVSVYRPGS